MIYFNSANPPEHLPATYVYKNFYIIREAAGRFAVIALNGDTTGVRRTMAEAQRLVDLALAPETIYIPQADTLPTLIPCSLGYGTPNVA